MWDGLKELIWEIIVEAWCWLLQKLFELAVKVLVFVTNFFPDVPVPGWLVAPDWGVEGIKMIAWLIPTAAIGWAVILWAAWEISDILAIYLYRSLFR